MKLTIKRFQHNKSYNELFTIDTENSTTLLAILHKIKSSIDPSLTFSAGCKSGVCGSCAVLVNGKEQLACSYKYKDGDHIEPLKYHVVLRDLKIDKYKTHTTIKTILQHINTNNNSHSIETVEDENRIKTQTDCILCDSCYSSCPVLAVNPDFLGPFALTRAWRYTANHKMHEQTASTTLENIQKNGIWDCTLCGECTIACPQGIDPKTDIIMLRSKAVKSGYNDPNFNNMNFGTPDFGSKFNSNI